MTVKKEISTLIILVVLLTVNAGYMQATAKTRIKPQNFIYLAGIEEAVKRNMLHRIHISPDIGKKCAPDFKDIRLYSADYREIPFVILKNKLAAEPARVFNFKTTGYEEDDTCSILTVETPANIPVVDSIDIVTPERNFKKQVYIYGSEDGKSWEELPGDFIYDFSAQVNLRKTKLQLPGVKYAFFKLRLCNAQKPESGRAAVRLRYEQLDFSVENTGEKKLHIAEILGSYGAPRQDKTVYDEESFSRFAIITDNQDKTVIELDAGLPCSEISFDIENANFYRNISVYGKKNKGGAFNKIFLTTQQVYRFSLGDMDEKKQTIACPASGYKNYRFEIDNKNSPPLKIKRISLRWVQANLYFIGLDDSDRCTLYFGGDAEIPAPDYDISAFLRQDNIAGQEYLDLTVGEIKLNSEYIPPDTGDKKTIIEKNILTLVVVLLVILFGFWFYRLYKKIEKR